MKKFLVLGLLIAGCGQIDFTGQTLSPVKQPTDTSRYILAFEEVMQFKEGEYAEYVIQPSVPEGIPVVSVEGLPAGAEFNASSLKISWRVPLDTVKTVDPKTNNMTYSISIKLRSDRDPIDVLVRKAVLLVYKK